MEQHIDTMLSEIAETTRQTWELVNKLAEAAPQQADELLDIAGFAQLSGLSLQTVYRMTSIVPFSKVGRKLYIKRSDAIQWLTRNRRVTPSDVLDRAARVGMKGGLQ